MRVMVTGSREWIDPSIIRMGLALLAGRKPTTLVHGAAPGADTIAANVAESLGWDLEPHRPDYMRHHRHWAPKQRNIEMVESGIDYWVAFQVGESRGTAHAMSEAKKRGIPGTLWRVRDFDYAGVTREEFDPNG